MSSTVDLSKAVGFKTQDQPVSWNKRDLLTYAIGVGAKKDDLSLVYELHKSWAPLPTYPVVLSLKGDDGDVTDFVAKGRGEVIPGLPTLDPKRVVHATQSIEILKPIPAISGPGWKLVGRVSGVHENKSGIILEKESLLVDSKGIPYAKLFSAAFYLGSKATGKRFSKVVSSPPQAKPISKDRAPTWIIKDQTSPEQALIYRLCGDYNPLHIDPAPGKAAGFGGVILHGLSTFGFSARAIISEVGGGDPTTLKVFGARFTSPVLPGHALETRVWEVGPGPDGTVELAFETNNLTTGRMALGGGVAYIKKAERSKL